MEVELLGDNRKLSHILLTTSRMRTYKVRNNLLAEVFLLVYLVEDALEFLKQCERWLAHEFKHSIRSVLRSYLQASADMLAYKFASVLSSGSIRLLILALVQEQIVAHTTTNEALLNARQRVYRMIYFEQWRMIGYKIWTYLRIYARRTLAHGAGLRILAVHTIHVGRRPAEVGQIPLKVGHFHYLLHFAKHTLLRTTGNKFALMSTDGAKRTSAEAATVQIHRELYHVVGRNTLSLILWMRQTRVWQIKRTVKLF